MLGWRDFSICRSPRTSPIWS